MRNVLTKRKEKVMKQFTKYICVFLMMAGMSVSAWGTTTSSAVILPAGSTTYNSKDWRKHYAPCVYSSTEVEETICVSANNGYNVKFYHAADYGNEGLQLERANDAYIKMTINSSKGVDVVIGYKSNGNAVPVTLTGASDVNAPSSSSFTTTTIKTTTTSATLTINGNDDNVVYISYISITPKSGGTITLDCDDCVLGPHVSFDPKSYTYDAEDVDHGWATCDITITGVNIPNYTSIYYDVFDIKKGGVASDDCYMSVENLSDDKSYVYVNTETTFSEDICLYYYADEAGTYTATIRAYTLDANDDPVFNVGGEMQITLKYGSCTDPTVEFSSSTVYKAKNASSFTKTATAEDGGSDTHQTITYTSSNTDVATVNSSTGAVTLKTDAIGSTVITATAAANSTYCEGTASYTLYVYTNPTVNQTHFTGVSRTPTSLTAKGGQISNKGGLDIQAYGYVVGTSTSVDWNSKVASAGQNGDPGLNTDFGTFTTTTDLTPGTQYYVRVFAYNGKAFGYSTYGEFTTPYLITLNKNGGDTNGSAYVLPDGTTLTNISEPTREHYTVEGYYTTSGMTTKIATDEGALQASVEVSSTTWTNGSSQWKRGAGETFYAKWTPVDYTISFNSNGGSGSMSSTDKAYNSSYSLPSCTFTPPSGKVFDHWGAGSAGGTSYDVDDLYTVTGDITFYAVWKDGTPTDLVFSCAELEITGPTGNVIFITSAASKTVRSQEAFHIEGSGLSASQSITFTHSNSTIASKFAYKTSDGTALSTDASGEIDTDFYIYYTPDEGDTDDGLDVFTNLQAKVTEGLKPKASNILSTKTVMGRHLPADFVIAGKKDGKWYAMPSNMASTANPKPSEIAVDDFNNPSVAYTDASNKYGLAAPTASNISGGNGQYIRLTMSIEDGNDPAGPAPLFGSATGTRTLGKSTNAKATSDLSAGWWWQLKQTNTSITNPQDAKYTIYCANNTSSLSLRDNAGNPDWGLFASGVEELRLIPASDIPFAEAYFIEWGQHGGVIEVDAANAGGTGQAATSVVAHLGEATSSAITLSQTGTSGGKSSKYNYTVNFGDGINFAASTSNGAMLTLEWKNGETVKAISNIVVPKIIASSATMKSIMSGDAQWETEVHVLPDVTLTANAGDFESNDVMIKQLEIYPGATVVVTKGEAGSGTLKVKTLVLRNGWTCASGTRKYDVARLYITPSTASLAKNAVGDVWYMDWYIDYDQYYPIAVPWKVAVNSSNIVHRYTSNTATFGPSGSIRLRYYDGEQRATSGQSMIGQNWKDYGNENLPDYLEPSKGYSFSAKRPSGKAFSIVRMTLGIPSNDWTALGEQGEVSGTHKDQVSVTGWGKGTADWYAMGWNFIGNPYMCTFNGNDDGISGKLELQNGGSIKYATIPSIDFSNYDQVAIADAELKPARGFFIQANNAEAQNITFNASKIVDPTAAPARYMTQTEAIPEQEAYIRLSYEGGKDQMGLIIGEDYTEAYEVNADLAKVLGDAGFVKTYMQYGGMDMAYVAINQELAKAWIPVTVILPKDGEYTFSLMSSSEVEQLEGVYLIDYAENETVTNLIDKDYTFVADAATISNRFAINAIIGERQTPTDIDVINEGGDLNSDRPFKFLYRDKVYIYHCGVIYDATGKRVKEINK